MATVNELSVALTNSSTTPIHLATTCDFPSQGIVQIESELIKYTFAGDNQLIGITRGVQGTSGASHAVGKSVTFVQQLPGTAESNLVTILTSPASIPNASVDNFDIIDINTVAMDALALTIPSPTNPTPGRVLMVSHKATGAGTLSVNSVSLAAGVHHTFVWDGVSWLS